MIVKTHPKIVVGLIFGPLLVAAVALVRWLSGDSDPPAYGPGEAPVQAQPFAKATN